jgi:hypothetical protein
MSIAVNNFFTITQQDLTTPTSTQDNRYKLGQVVAILDTDTQMEKRFIYVKSHSALTQYQPYVLGYSNTSGSEVITAAPATRASGVTVVVPQVAFTSGYFGFVQVFGPCTALLANETHVAGDFLEILNAGTTFIVDETSGSTAYSTKSVAIQVGTLVGAGSTTINLIRDYQTSLVSAT